MKSYLGIETTRNQGQGQSQGQHQKHCLYLDLDQLIWERHHHFCPGLPSSDLGQLIQSCGEQTFRRWERQKLTQLTQQTWPPSPTLVALGAGALDQVALDILRTEAPEKHWLIWLDRPFEDCWQAICQDNTSLSSPTRHGRPLVARGKKAAQTLHDQRLPFYQQADYHFKWPWTDQELAQTKALLLQTGI